jgi:hypothetical protein
MVLWNVNQPLITIRHNKIKNGPQTPPSKNTRQFFIHINGSKHGKLDQKVCMLKVPL